MKDVRRKNLAGLKKPYKFIIMDLNKLVNEAFTDEPLIKHQVKLKSKGFKVTLFKRTFEFKTYVKVKYRHFLDCDEILCSKDAINKRVGLMTEEEYGKVEEKCKKIQEEFEKKEGWKPDSHYKK